ncbi:MAG: YdiU family protein [Gammaproteobacteria bacterium]|nr:YdiU family protein [Rhodocyclaceae bacterium]MBU3909215.1 YdiU family protein [Gammaproteobacteria bacterium]MBU3990155.1 YdiU family protein [Gammaproteobacteria bacterium]MBU4005625.1 YdiU family protein [Gammaproteobacteria bacterium]MBU4020822.1 YdiU family protein [Gammaproteobacteria bacterium]
MPNIAIPFDNTYARDLPGFYAACQPERAPTPALLYFNHELAEELRLGLAGHDAPALAAMFSGNALPAGAMPIAQAYAGHQFGSFSPQLGDGRALLIGEVIDRYGRRRDIALKGSGRTPFSRRGDGKAAVGPMLREVLVGEAMHALGIPTTRALAVVASGAPVRRETLLPGAILTRIAASHLRVGTFEYFAAHGTTAMVRQLADYAIARHDPDLVDSPQRYADFLRAVAERQAALLAQWMHAGFIHGVMNTDNMGIPGETIDYGPCAFMEAYDPRTVFSSIDAGGRYAYAAQPDIARWNLARLAEALLPLIDTSEGRAIEAASEVLDAFPERYHQHWLAGLRAKLGLGGELQEEADAALGESWLDLLHAQGVDYTLAWRRLADAATGNEAPLRALFAAPQGLERWLERWRARCAAADAAMTHDGPPAELRAQRMRRVNPWLIARNQRVEEALEAAERGELAPFEQLLAALRRPYDEDPALARYAEPASDAFMADFRTYCGT